MNSLGLSLGHSAMQSEYHNQPGMLKFPPRNPELGLLFLKWVTRKSKHLEGQIYPAVSNIWNLA